MSKTLYVARSTAIAARTLGNETMIMSAADSRLFTLNEVASIIWQSADGATPLEEIAKKVCMQYDVAPEVALKDAELLVEGLAAARLMIVSEKRIGGVNSTSSESECPA